MAMNSSAVFDPVGRPGESADRGGSLNQLSPRRTQIRHAHAMGTSNCLVEVALWREEPARSAALETAKPLAVK